MLNGFEVVLDNGTQVVIMLDKVSRFVKTKEGALKVYYVDGTCDTTMEDYEQMMNTLMDKSIIYFVGGRL